MDNSWASMGDGRSTMREVCYTPGIDIGEDFVAPEEGFNTGAPGNGPPLETSSGSRNKVASGKGASTRSKNFSTKEDETLCLAYLNVSNDPIVGVNQAQGSYWARITEYFHEHKRTSYTRSLSSLQHRWGDIQKDTSRFCGYYSEIERKHQSGKSEDDQIKDALQMFDGLVGTQFKFLHCWLILRYEMKWNSWLATLSGNKKIEPTVGVQAGGDPTLPPRIDRPIGRDRAKKQRSNSTSSSSSACLEVLQKMSMDQHAFTERQEVANKEEASDVASRSDRKLALQEHLVEIQKSQVEIQKQMLKLQQEDSEDRVMSMDVEKMVPWVHEYYINKQKKIAQRSLGGDGSGGPSGL